MPRHWRSWAAPTALLILLMVSAAAVLTMLEERRPPAIRAQELAYLPKGEHLRVAVLGYRQLTADLIWLKAVQHFGEGKPLRSQFVWAYHAADVVTDLDPQFMMAYLATGTALGVWGGMIDESIAILEKGMKNIPDEWRFPFHVGYDYFYELCDSSRAAPYIRAASTLPGAPAYLPRLAARMTVEGGDADLALEFLQRVDEQSRDPRMHEALSLKMKEVVAERDIRVLERAVQEYRTRYKRVPSAFDEVIAKGIIERVPNEPLGGAYVLHDDGSVTATGLKQRLKVIRFNSCQRQPGAGATSTTGS